MSYSKLLEKLCQVENNDASLVELKEMILKYEMENKRDTYNKSNGTDKLAKMILKYIKAVDENRQFLKQVLKDNTGYSICNGYTLFTFNSDLKFEGLPITETKESEKGKFPDIEKLYFVGNELNESIDIKLLKEKTLLYKANKKKATKENCYYIDNKYFNPLYLEECIQMIGDIEKLETQDSSELKPLMIYGKNGKCLILPIKLKDE